MSAIMDYTAVPFPNVSSSTGAKWLKIGTWLFLRVPNSNLKRNWPVSNVLLVIFNFKNPKSNLLSCYHG